LTQNSLERELLEAVEEGLSSLGDSPKQAILFFLESSFKIERDNIPANLTEFSEALEKIFGPGASHIEKLIVRCLYRKLGLKFEEANSWSFLDYVDVAKKRLPAKKNE